MRKVGSFQEVRYREVLAWMTIAMTFLWLILYACGVEQKLVKAMAPLLPEWMLLANLPLSLILAAIIGLRSRVFVEIVFLCGVLFVVSYSLLPLSLKMHRTAALIVAVLLNLEVFVIIPRINARHRNRSAVVK